MPQDDETFLEMFMRMPPEEKARAKELIEIGQKNTSQDDIDVMKVIANLAVDACQGDRLKAADLMRWLVDNEPVVKKLCYRVGCSIIDIPATKQ